MALFRVSASQQRSQVLTITRPPQHPKPHCQLQGQAVQTEERRDSAPHVSLLPLLSPVLLHTPRVSGADAVSGTRTFYVHGDSVLARQHPWFSRAEHVTSGRMGGEKGVEMQSS